MADELVEGLGAGGVDDGQAGDPVDQAEMLELDERLAEGAGVAEVAAGHDDPVGRLPGQGLQDPVHDRLLAFEAERVDRVHQVDAEPVGHLADPVHGVVEVADDLDRQGAVVERLGQLAIGDLARADEDDRLEAERRGRAVDRQRRRGVAGAGAGDPAGVDHPGVGERRGHPVVLEAPRGVHPLVLEPELGRDSCRRTARPCRRPGAGSAPRRWSRSSRAGRTGGVRGTARRPRSSERVEPVGPLGLEVREPTGDRAGGPSRRPRRAGRRTRGRRWPPDRRRAWPRRPD